MAVLYIRYSAKLNRFYTGSCKDISFRLEQHLKKEYKNSFTSKADDWILYFAVENLEYNMARVLEAHIKKMNSSVYIKNLKKYPEIWQKLLVKYS